MPQKNYAASAFAQLTHTQFTSRKRLTACKCKFISKYVHTQHLQRSMSTHTVCPHSMSTHNTCSATELERTRVAGCGCWLQETACNIAACKFAYDVKKIANLAHICFGIFRKRSFVVFETKPQQSSLHLEVVETRNGHVFRPFQHPWR